MDRQQKYRTQLQFVSLVILRIFIGWHILFEGLSKLIMPNWSSYGFLKESQWIMKGFSQWIILHKELLKVVDFINTWGLIAIGTGLVLGLFSRLAAICGAILLFVYYINNPPFIGMEYSLPMEGSYIIISKTLIEVAALFVLALFSTSEKAGLDYFIKGFGKKGNTENGYY